MEYGWAGGIAGNKILRMIHPEELRIGNRVFWKPAFSTTNVLIQVEVTSVLSDKVGYVRSHLEHRVEPFEDDLIAKELPYAPFEQLIPIPLTDLPEKDPGKNIKYPGWIKYLHELQNWYYWEHEKKEIDMD